MCYTHVLTQDTRRLIESELDQADGVNPSSRGPGPGDPPEPLPEPDPCEPIQAPA